MLRAVLGKTSVRQIQVNLGEMQGAGACPGVAGPAGKPHNHSHQDVVLLQRCLGPPQPGRRELLQEAAGKS